MPEGDCAISVIFYYLAIGTLLPWNFFINSNGYWMYKFRTVSQNGSNTTTSLSENLNSLQLEFMSDLANAAMIPNVTFLVLNGIMGHRFKMKNRFESHFLNLKVFFENDLNQFWLSSDYDIAVLLVH